MPRAEAPLPEEWERSRELRRYDGLRAISCETGDGARLALVGEIGDARLDRIAQAHERVRSPHVSRIVERGTAPAGAFLLFDCDAVTDLEPVVAELTATLAKIAYPASIAFNEFLMDAFESVHLASVAPLGAFGWRSVMMGPSGRLWLFGLGENFPVRRADGALVGGLGVVEAPEFLLGIAATPASDVFLLHATMRSMLPHVELLPMFEEALRQADARAAAIYAELAGLSAAALEPVPSRRIADVASLRARYRAVRALVPDMPAPDPEALASLLRGLLARLGHGPVLVVDEGRRTIDIDGERLDLAERGTQWRVVVRLLEAHATGEAIAVEGLYAAGWPGERGLADAARARVYVTVSALRKTALRAHLQKRDEGYFLSPELRVRRL